MLVADSETIWKTTILAVIKLLAYWKLVLVEFHTY